MKQKLICLNTQFVGYINKSFSHRQEVQMQSYRRFPYFLRIIRSWLFVYERIFSVSLLPFVADRRKSLRFFRCSLISVASAGGSAAVARCCGD